VIVPAAPNVEPPVFADTLIGDEKAVAREIRRLEKAMLDHARNLEFEQAATARDQLRMLKDRVLLSGA
jgi:excinuclease ABC subunit B